MMGEWESRRKHKYTISGNFKRAANSEICRGTVRFLKYLSKECVLNSLEEYYW